MGKILSGVSARVEEVEDKGEKLESICSALNMTEKELKKCQHDVDITKTCRSIVKQIYPNANDRGKMLISTMDPCVLQAIQSSQSWITGFSPAFSHIRRLRETRTPGTIQSCELDH